LIPAGLAAEGRAMSFLIRHPILPHLILPIVGMILLLGIGTSGYQWLEELPPIDAFYMTVITISTVGFGEVKPLSPAGRIFTVGLIAAGGGLTAYFLKTAAEFFLSGEWRTQLAHKRRQAMLTKLMGHIIVCGYGRVGREVAHELQAEKLPFVVIDKDPEKIARIEAAGHLALQGNAANELYLKAAGIMRARGLVAAVNSDAENVFIVLTARELRPDLTIVARANYEDSESKLLRAGANRVIFPYRISGRRMVTMLVRPHVADFLDEVTHAGEQELLVEQVWLAQSSPLVGQSLSQADLRNRFAITILACRSPDGQVNTHPGSEMILCADSYLVVLGTRDQIQALARLAEGP
jgi:voltage-gated potassium channel